MVTQSETASGRSARHNQRAVRWIPHPLCDNAPPRQTSSAHYRLGASYDMELGSCWRGSSRRAIKQDNQLHLGGIYVQRYEPYSFRCAPVMMIKTSRLAWGSDLRLESCGVSWTTPIKSKTCRSMTPKSYPLP